MTSFLSRTSDKLKRVPADFGWLTCHSETGISSIRHKPGNLVASRWEAANHEERSKRRNLVRRRLGLPDSDHAKEAVLASQRSQRSYRHAIVSLSVGIVLSPACPSTKVTRYRIHLEDRQLVPRTTNVRLAAVRRLAYEAADSGLLSPETTFRHTAAVEKIQAHHSSQSKREARFLG